MKTKRLMALVMALALCLTAVLTGCGKQPEIMGLMPVLVSESDTLITTESTAETEVIP